MLLRAVTLKKPGETPADAPKAFPTSMDGMRRFLDAHADWREADLKTCLGALRTLLALEDVRWWPFDDTDRGRMTGHEPSELIVTADADTYVVKAGGLTVYAARDMGEPGGPGAWARRMLAVAEPCLRPTPAPAPWSVRSR